VGWQPWASLCGRMLSLREGHVAECHIISPPYVTEVSGRNIQIDSKYKQDPGLKIRFLKSVTIFGMISKACQGITISSRTLLASSK